AAAAPARIRDPASRGAAAAADSPGTCEARPGPRPLRPLPRQPASARGRGGRSRPGGDAGLPRSSRRPGGIAPCVSRPLTPHLCWLDPLDRTASAGPPTPRGLRGERAGRARAATLTPPAHAFPVALDLAAATESAAPSLRPAPRT